MADVRCPRCSEPWDLDELHEMVSVENPSLMESRPPYASPYGSSPESKRYARWTKRYEKAFGEMRARFYREGCGVFGSRCEPNERGAVVSALADLAGDDIDGFASDLEDAERFGLL